MASTIIAGQPRALEKIVYIKGGDVRREAQALFPRAGEKMDGGPEKFLLSVLANVGASPFRLVGVSQNTVRETISAREVFEYGLRPASGGTLKRRTAYLLAAAAFIRDTIKFKPTRVLCGLEGFFGVMALIAARLSGAEFILLTHCALDTEALSGLTRKANAVLCTNADAIIAHGPFLYDQASKLAKQNVPVVEWNNGLDAAHAELLDHHPHEDKPSQNILYLGRMEIRKGVMDLCSAFLRLSNLPEASLKFIGAGAALEPLRDFVKKNNAQDRIQVLGAVPFAAVFDHLIAAKVVVTPTHAAFPEGLCQSAIEAFYAGKPVIAPDYGPFPYIVEHERNGLLYQTDSEEELRKTLERYFSDPLLQEKLAEGARQSGQLFRHPDISFNEAIEMLFEGRIARHQDGISKAL